MTHAQTDHIHACMQIWRKHQKSCDQCFQWAWHVRGKPCEAGKAAWDEYCQAIEANRDCEQITAMEADNEQ